MGPDIVGLLKDTLDYHDKHSLLWKEMLFQTWECGLALQNLLILSSI